MSKIRLATPEELLEEELVDCAECTGLPDCECRDCEPTRPCDDDPYQIWIDNEITG